jgi:hypothetical protein
MIEFNPVKEVLAYGIYVSRRIWNPAGDEGP